VTPRLSSYDATVIAMIIPRKQRRFADAFLQPGVATRNYCAAKNTVLDKVNLVFSQFGKTYPIRTRRYISNGHSSRFGPKF